MYYRIKLSNMPGVKGILTYLTEEENFAAASKKVLNELNDTEIEVEEIKWMKNFKPAINKKYADTNKLYIVKIAEDIKQDNGTVKTVKYELPVFANDSNELQKIVNDYISQGMENMRLTTISETKWIFV